jgi:hypothetical protein
MKSAILKLVSVFFSFTLGAVLSAQVPQLINYQGRIAVSKVNFEGEGHFKFALMSGGADLTTYWSNDGTSTAGSEPASAVVLTVTKGLYSVQLGDTTLSNMTAIPATVFTNPDVRLRVWFNDGSTGSQLLPPDQRIAAVGYALIASTLAANPTIAGTVTATAFSGDGSGLTNLPASVDIDSFAKLDTIVADQTLLSTTTVVEFFNRQILRQAVNKARTQRVAIVGIGDSNQLKDSHGWAEGFAKEFGEEFGWFGSGVLRNRFGTPENSFVFRQIANSRTPTDFTNLPEGLEQYRQQGPQTAFFLASGDSLTVNGSSDYYIFSNKAQVDYPSVWPLGVSLQLDVSYANFATKYKTALTATAAAWQSVNTVRFLITEDLGKSHAGMYILASTFANASNNGTFEITAVGAGYVDVTTARSDATDDESGVSALADIEQDQTGDAGKIRTFARRAQSPWSSAGLSSDLIPTLSADYGVGDNTVVSAPNAARDTWTNIQGGFQNVGLKVHGPLFLSGMQLTSPDILSGIAYSTLIYQGGRTMQAFYNTLYNSDDAMLVEYWRQIRLNLNGNKSCIVVINGGLNDKNETDASPINAYTGDSAAAYKERIELIIQKLHQTWAMTDEKGGSGDKDDMTIVIMPSHPISTPADTELTAYRTAAKELQLVYPNVAWIMIDELVPQSDFVSGGYYQSSGSDTSHLERVGYRAVAKAIVDLVK